MHSHTYIYSFVVPILLCTEVWECPYRNGGCMQYCRNLPGGAGVQCGCADGYELEDDGRSCTQTGETKQYF